MRINKYALRDVKEGKNEVEFDGKCIAMLEMLKEGAKRAATRRHLDGSLDTGTEVDKLVKPVNRKWNL